MFGPQFNGFNGFNGFGGFTQGFVPGFVPGFGGGFNPGLQGGFGGGIAGGFGTFPTPWNTTNWNTTNTLTTNTTPTQAITQLLVALSQQTQWQLQSQQFALTQIIQALTLLQQTTQQNSQLYNQQANTNTGYGLGWGMFPGQQFLQQQQSVGSNTNNNVGTWTNGTNGQQFGNPFGGQQQSVNPYTNTTQGYQGQPQYSQGFAQAAQGNNLNTINQAYGPAVFGNGNAPWQQAFLPRTCSRSHRRRM